MATHTTSSHAALRGAATLPLVRSPVKRLLARLAGLVASGDSADVARLGLVAFFVATLLTALARVLDGIEHL